jgi:hypothetical protein
MKLIRSSLRATIIGVTCILLWTLLCTNAEHLVDRYEDNLYYDIYSEPDQLYNLPQYRPSIVNRKVQQDEVDELCSNVCDDIQETALLSSVAVDDSDNKTVVGKVFDNVIGFFGNNKSLFGRMMNSMLKLFVHRRNDAGQEYMVPTNRIFPLLSNYSTKAKSLADMIRSKAVTDIVPSNPPEVILNMIDLSAQNIEQIAYILEPLLDEMRQNETINITTVSCSFLHITTFIRDDTIPNIISLTKILSTISSDNKLNMINL